MATKAERFKAASERKGLRDSKRKTPRGPGTLKTTADTSKPGVGSDDRRWGGDSTGARNRSKHAEQTATYGYEDSNADTARPSRKSTRGGSRQHIKPDNPLKNKQLLKHTSPKNRSQHRQKGRASLRG
jgi:hypothetical protein